MSDDERKPRVHIHTGGLIILIIIILILFKVDLISKIKSPTFQKNVSYIEETSKDLWQKYISNPLKAKTGEVFVDFTNKGIKQIQDNVTKSLTPVENTENTNEVVKK